MIIRLRERCSIEAFQMWMDAKEPGFRVVGVKAEAPCQITLEVEEIAQVKPTPTPPVEETSNVTPLFDHGPAA